MSCSAGSLCFSPGWRRPDAGTAGPIFAANSNVSRSVRSRDRQVLPKKNGPHARPRRPSSGSSRSRNLRNAGHSSLRPRLPEPLSGPKTHRHTAPSRWVATFSCTKATFVALCVESAAERRSLVHHHAGRLRGGAGGVREGNCPKLNGSGPARSRGPVAGSPLEALYTSLSHEERDELLQRLLLAASIGGQAVIQRPEECLLDLAGRELVGGLPGQ